MFKDISQQSDRAMVSISVDDTPLKVPTGYTVAAALLASGHNTNRSSVVSGQQRGPYCMMGVCFECLAEVDGIPNRQGCMTEVREGMSIRFQHGSGEVQIPVSLQEEDLHAS